MNWIFDQASRSQLTLLMVNESVALLLVLLTVFSFESRFTENGVDEAIPLKKGLVLDVVVVVVVFVDDVDPGRELAKVNDFLDGSWLCDRFVREVGDVGERLVRASLFVAVVVIVFDEVFSNLEMRPREPRTVLLFGTANIGGWLFSCSFWSSDRCESSVDADW